MGKNASKHAETNFMEVNCSHRGVREDTLEIYFKAIFYRGLNVKKRSVDLSSNGEIIKCLLGGHKFIYLPYIEYNIELNAWNRKGIDALPSKGTVHGRGLEIATQK